MSTPTSSHSTPTFASQVDEQLSFINALFDAWHRHVATAFESNADWWASYQAGLDIDESVTELLRSMLITSALVGTPSQARFTATVNALHEFRRHVAEVENEIDWSELDRGGRTLH